MLIKDAPVDVLPHDGMQHDDAQNVRASRRADIVWPIAVTVLAASALVPAATAHAAPAPVTPSQVAQSSARTTLESLAVKGRAPKTGYERSQFGQAWSDDVSVADGHNGCDTRNDILGRDLSGVTLKPGTNGCVVLSGTLDDPYTRTSIAFTRGSATSSKVQIDHVVALSDAWQKGAQQLSAEQRRNLANDPRNLQATDGRTNQAKGAGDAATWLPPNKSYRCTYVERQIAVKAIYHLWVTAAEKQAMIRILSNCSAPEADSPKPAPAPQTAPPEAVAPPQVAPSSTTYANCAQARAAGVAPLHRGQPGYSAKLDRDGDGVACE